MTKEDPLSSSKFSVAYSKRHIKAFEAEDASFFNGNPYTKVIDFQHPNSDVYKLKLTAPIPRVLAGIAFDALNHLRIALDQATFAVAIASGANGKQAHFPFGDTAAEVQARHLPKGGGSRQLPKEVFDFVAAFEPYKGGNDLLWALNKLCNSHKHEIVVPTAIYTGGGKFSAHFLGEVSSFRFPPKWDSAKNEMVLMVVPHGSNADYHFNISTFVTFANVEAVSRQPAHSVLTELARIVEGIVIGIEAEGRRLGLFPN